MNRSSPRLVALVAALLTPTWAAAQTTIFNSNGFESPTFTQGNLTGAQNPFGATFIGQPGQQGFQAAPGNANTAAVIQTSTTFAGSQALQIIGANIVDDSSWQHHNFWFKTLGNPGVINPVNSAKPFVQLHSTYNLTAPGGISLATDIPLVGMYLEGYDSGGTQHAITPISMGADNKFHLIGAGGVTIDSNQTFARNQWLDVMAEYDFNAKTVSVRVNGQMLTFGASNPSTTVAFSSNVTTVAETGFVAPYNTFSGGGTSNSFFADDFSVIMSATSITPVPEPASCLAVAGLAPAGYRRLRKRPAAV